jgi:hypothetical protein
LCFPAPGAWCARAKAHVAPLGDFMKSAIVSGAVIGALILCGCSGPGTPEKQALAESSSASSAPPIIGFLGATEGSGIMLSSFERCTFTFVRIGLQRQRPRASQSAKPEQPEQNAPAPPANGSPIKHDLDGPRSANFSLNAPAQLAGSDLHIKAFGSYFGAYGPIGTAKVEFGGQSEARSFRAEPVDPEPDFKQSGENFELELTGKVVEGVNVVTVTLAFDPPAKPDDLQVMDLQSVTLAADGASCTGVVQPKPDDSKPEEPKPAPAKP